MAKDRSQHRRRLATRDDVAKLRQGMVALCRAVAGLARELTGREMSIRIDHDDGTHVWSTPKLDGVKWSKSSVDLELLASYHKQLTEFRRMQALLQELYPATRA